MQVLASTGNPVFGIKYAGNEPAIIGFSKQYHHAFNPQSDFAAIMTCTDADKGCPFIPAAEARIALPFEDPKNYDNTPLQAAKYDACSLQIATELFYVFSTINALYAR